MACRGGEAFGTALLHKPTNYGGGQLKLSRQIRVALSRVGGKTIEAVLQVQHNAPVDFLLGTDLQSKLGFVLMSTEGGGTGFDLLEEKCWRVNSPVTVTTDTQTEMSTSTTVGATVSLIQATRVGCHLSILKWFSPRLKPMN